MLKILIAVAAALVVFSAGPAFGQISMGAAPQEGLRVSIDENGTAHVVHLVAGNASSAVHVDLVQGNLTNLSVSDESGKTVQYSTINQNPVSILLLPTQRNFTVIQYDLQHAVSNRNGIWEWDYYTPADAQYTDFFFPKGVDVIWTLSDTKDAGRPVYLAGNGIRQVGNGVHLAYIINEPQTVQTVQWQNQTFNIGIRTLANVGPPAFDQASKAYAFDIDKPGSLVTVVMPKALLWGPYEGRIDAKPLLTTDFHENDTYAWIGMMPDQNGTLQITGTTAIPEFPLFVPLAIAISAVVALRFTSRLNFI